VSEETVTGFSLQYLTRKTVSLSYSISLKKELHLWPVHMKEALCLLVSCEEALDEVASVQKNPNTSELPKSLIEGLVNNIILPPALPPPSHWEQQVVFCREMQKSFSPYQQHKTCLGLLNFIWRRGGSRETLQQPSSFWSETARKLERDFYKGL